MIDSGPAVGVVTGRGPELGIVIVSYNVRDLLRDCLMSLRSARGVDGVAVVVVDNASHDDSAAMVRAEFPEVTLIDSGVNHGYVLGNNLGLRHLGGLPRPPRNYLLLNPDTVLPPDALRALLDQLDEFPSIGAIGPRLVMGNGELDWACRRGFPTPLTSLYHMIGLGRLFPRSRRFGRYRLTFLDERAVADVDAIVGAFMLVRGQTLDEVGLLDDRFFMYGEDLDLAYRIKQAGWRVVYNGRIDVLHYKRQSSRRSRRAAREFYRAMMVFFRKHYAPITPGPARLLIELGIRALWVTSMLRRPRGPVEGRP